MKKLGTGVGLFDIEFQIGSLTEINFAFIDESGLPVDIGSWTFEFFVKTNAGDRVKQISKTLGSGINFPIYESGAVLLSFTENNIAEGEYVWELRRTDVNKPMLGGLCNWSFDPKQGDTEITTPVINGTLTVQVTLSGGSGGDVAGMPQKQGIWTADAFPTTSGVDEDGTEIKDGYFWLIGGVVGVTIGGVYLSPGTFLWSNQDSPDDDFSITGWKYF